MAIPSSSLATGIFAGLACAFLSAVSYLVARHHGSNAPEGSLRMLVFAHALMGAVCLPMAWWLWPDQLPLAGPWLGPLGASTLSYLVGQAALFAALRRVDASRLAPLLGLKIAILAVLVSCVLGSPLDRRQWIAVGISVAAAALLQRSGSAVPWTAFGRILLACLCFAVSDLFIVGLIDAVQSTDGGISSDTTAVSVTRLRAGGFAMAVTYILCGVIALPFVRWAARGRSGGWLPAFHYAAAWLGAMVALYICFGLVGAVFGNILQSTRGIMAVGLGAVLASMGWHELEQPVDRGTLVRRGLAAALMTLAIAIYAMPS